MQETSDAEAAEELSAALREAGLQLIIAA